MQEACLFYDERANHIGRPTPLTRRLYYQRYYIMYGSMMFAVIPPLSPVAAGCWCRCLVVSAAAAAAGWRLAVDDGRPKPTKSHHKMPSWMPHCVRNVREPCGVGARYDVVVVVVVVVALCRRRSLSSTLVRGDGVYIKPPDVGR